MPHSTRSLDRLIEVLRQPKNAAIVPVELWLCKAY